MLASERYSPGKEKQTEYRTVDTDETPLGHEVDSVGVVQSGIQEKKKIPGG